MKPRIELTRNGYGFGYDWLLVIPATKTKRARLIWLGQDAKVCHRILGMRPRDVAAELVAACGSADIEKNAKANECLAAMVVKALGGLRAVRKAYDWEVCAE